MKPHLVNNYIKTSTVAFDYAKCRNKLSSALHENEKKGPGFSANLSSNRWQENLLLNNKS